MSQMRFLLSLLPGLGNSVQGQANSTGIIQTGATSRAGERCSARLLRGGGLPKVRGSARDTPLGSCPCGGRVQPLYQCSGGFQGPMGQSWAYVLAIFLFWFVSSPPPFFSFSFIYLFIYFWAVMLISAKILTSGSPFPS